MDINDAVNRELSRQEQIATNSEREAKEAKAYQDALNMRANNVLHEIARQAVMRLREEEVPQVPVVRLHPHKKDALRTASVIGQIWVAGDVGFDENECIYPTILRKYRVNDDPYPNPFIPKIKSRSRGVISVSGGGVDHSSYKVNLPGYRGVVVDEPGRLGQGVLCGNNWPSTGWAYSCKLEGDEEGQPVINKYDRDDGSVSAKPFSGIVVAGLLLALKGQVNF